MCSYLSTVRISNFFLLYLSDDDDDDDGSRDHNDKLGN